MLKVARWTVLTLLAVAVVALAFSVGYFMDESGGGSRSVAPGEAVSSGDGEAEVDFDTLNQIMDILGEEYVEPDRLDDRTLYEAAINGLLQSLSDTGTFYVDPDTYRVNVLPSGTFEGIGATVSQQGGEIVIVSPIEGTPAEEAGIQAGDVIVAVDGESTEGWTVDKAVLKIRGPRGTPVTLTIRHADQVVEDITIVRDEISVESVSTTPPGGALKDENGDIVTDIAYVHLREFTARTDEELRPILRDASQGDYRGLILDLRSNPGGLLNATVGVADMFLDEGVILVEVSRDGDERVFNATGGGEAVDVPLVVLVNQFSASGAEVLAAAVHDNGRGVLLGEQTFGKGTVNVARKLSDGGALFVTIARWLTPERIQIDGVGIHPDIEVALSDEDIDLRRDSQLLRAIDHLRSQAAVEPTPVGAAAP